MAIDYPRVLIIGMGFNTFTSTGITFSNLFRGWPNDRLAVATTGKEYISSDICDNYYLLGTIEDHWAWPFCYITRTGDESGPINSCTASKEFLNENRIPPSSPARDLFYAVLNSLGINDLIKKLDVSQKFLEWAKDFSPDLIYCTLSTLKMIRFVEKLSRVMQLPTVVHMMDDWPSTIYRHGLFSPYMRWRTDTEFRSLIARSTTFGISQEMCDEYQDRYGKEFTPFHNPVDLVFGL